MAHNRTTQYSAPFRRNNLLGLNQYAASANFPTLGTWDRARTDDLYVVRGTVGRSQPVCITVVGAISSDKPIVKPHGNYDPEFMPQEQIGKKAKLQFVLTCPADDAEFSSDYFLALKRFIGIQDEVAASTSGRNHFIQGNNMKMNFFLFEPKDDDEDKENESPGSDMDISDDDDDDCDKKNSQTENCDKISKKPSKPIYEVTSAYKEAWAEVEKDYYNNIMEVYGVDEELVDYRNFPKVLTCGTTVAVSFILKHYAIRERGSSQPVSDTYTAIVRSISILKPAEKKIRPSHSVLPKRRPLPTSQVPTRGTLKFAADTFAPVKRASVSHLIDNSRRKEKGRPNNKSKSPSPPRFVEGSSKDGSSPLINLDVSGFSPALISALLPLLATHLQKAGLPVPVEPETSKDEPSVPSPTPSTSSTLSTISEHPEDDAQHETSASKETPSSDASFVEIDITGPADPKTGNAQTHNAVVSTSTKGDLTIDTDIATGSTVSASGVTDNSSNGTQGIDELSVKRKSDRKDVKKRRT